MSYRILHLSDLHLDRAFAGSGVHGDDGTHGNVARRRRHDLRDALRRAGSAAQERGCDLISIGGDLYEHERAGPDTAVFLTELFASWAPIRVAIAPGNHDPYMPGSLYESTDWPANVHVFSEPRLSPLGLADGLTLWGLAHREPAWQGNPLDGDPLGTGGGGTDRPGTDDTHIALFHGAEIGSRPDGKSIHGPFDAQRIEACGFSSALSGHYHRRRIDRAHCLLYPGSPEPLTFDETGARGPVIVDCSGSGQIAYEPLDLNAWTAVSTDCDLSARSDGGGVSTANGAFDAAGAVAEAAVAGLDTDRTMLRLTLTGSVGPAIALDTFTLETVLREATLCAVVKVRDHTTAAINVATAATDPSARGAFTRTLLSALEDAANAEERAVLEDALRYGLQALSGVEVGLR